MLLYYNIHVTSTFKEDSVWVSQAISQG